MWKKVQQTLQASIYIPPTRKRTLFKYRDHFWKGGFPYPAKPMFVKGILIFVLYWKRPYLTYLWNRIGFIYAAVGQRCLCRHSKRFVTPKNYPRAWKSFSMDQKRGRALKNMLPSPFWETMRRDTLIPKPARSALSRHGPHLGWATRLALSDNPDNIIFAQNWASLGLHNSSVSSCSPLLYNLAICVMAKNVLKFHVLFRSNRQNHMTG